jgi:hypothetical protein
MEVDNFTAFSAQIENTVGKALAELKKEYGEKKDALEITATLQLKGWVWKRL